MSETEETRLKRLRMRSARRGIKEMDIILSRFADVELGALNRRELDIYDGLLSENDQDLYQWVTGQARAPELYGPLVSRIAAVARAAVPDGGDAA